MTDETDLKGLENRLKVLEAFFSASARATDVTLKEHIEIRLKALEDAGLKSERLLDVRLASMNEFREALKDQSTKFFTIASHEAYQKAVDADLRVLRESRALLEGKASQSTVNVALLLSTISAFTAIAGLLHSVFAK